MWKYIYYRFYFSKNIMNPELYIFFWLLIWAFIWYAFWKAIRHKDLMHERSKSVRKSRSIILWETYEKIAPLLQSIPYHPKDMTFLWKWVDYVVFDWLSAWNLKSIVFLEIKTWKSRQNKNEKQIESIINSKKVSYEIKRLW